MKVTCDANDAKGIREGSGFVAFSTCGEASRVVSIVEPPRLRN